MLETQAPRGAHVVNFYDTEAELITGASVFLGEGLREGEVVVSLATRPHRAAIECQLHQWGLDVDALEDDGFYVPLDAPTVMRSFMVDGTVDRELARQAVLPFVQAAASKRRPMRAFGEIVSMMLQSGQIEDALVVEQIRSQLAADFDCSLYCAYPARLVHEAQSLQALTQMCALHSDLVAPGSYTRHELGASPVSVAAQSFLPVPDAVGAARNFVVASMRGWDLSELLVGTATVAVVQVLHQIMGVQLRTFRVGLSAFGTGVRLQIEYPGDPADETASTFGAFGLLDRVAKEWGSEHNRDTKVLWAVFG